MERFDKVAGVLMILAGVIVTFYNNEVTNVIVTILFFYGALRLIKR